MEFEKYHVLGICDLDLNFQLASKFNNYGKVCN
jgi:hypothetical protein